jgi:Protein of unknown function (DUF2950)
MSRSIQQFLWRNRTSASFAIILAVAVALACWPVRAQQQSMAKQPSYVPEQQPQGKSFASPEDAAAALYAAALKDDDTELMVIFGPDSKDIIHWNDDPAVRKAHREDFARRYDQMHRLVKEPDGTVALYVGAVNWPVPIPLVEYKGAWYFDAELGKKEMMFRRIGRNELESLEVCHALVDAEKDYYASAQHYTMKFVSSGMAHDGLYWSESGSMKSPIGPYLAHAGIGSSGESTRPYHGYYYRILTEQGPNAPGGAKNFVEGGKETGGFAILAFPAVYRSSGVMTFMMDQNGVAYEKDLGPTTETLAKQINAFNPDNTWKKAE